MTDDHVKPAAPEKPRSRLVWALDIVLVRMRFIGLLVGVMLVAAYWDDIKAHAERWLPHDRTAAIDEYGVAGVEYFCPMHAQVVRAEPGNCPICGMPLSKRDKHAAAQLPEGILARVQFSPFRIAQGGIRTSPVEWRPLVREIETVGFVDYDERRLSRITARFPGRVESVAVDFRGAAVELGRPLATIYSPEVFAAEESFLSALRALRADAAEPGADAPSLERSRGVAEASRRRLGLWGLSPAQIGALETTGQASSTIEVLAPLSGVVTKKAVVVGDYVAEGAALFDVADLSSVWIKARVYEDDLGLVAVGQEVTTTSSAFPGETFVGKVAFLDPFVDRATRTADLRIDVANPAGRLKPGMYVAATVRIPFAGVEPYRSQARPDGSGEARTVLTCPMHPEIESDVAGKCPKCGMNLERTELPAGPTAADVLVVPETAVVDTGKRKVVYVESSEGVFDAHEVVLGPRAGVYFPVISGLTAGMRVATAGSFLIDAETRLNPAAAGTYFGASGATK